MDNSFIILKYNGFSDRAPCTNLHTCKGEQKDRTKTLTEFPDHILNDCLITYYFTFVAYQQQTFTGIRLLKCENLVFDFDKTFSRFLRLTAPLTFIKHMIGNFSMMKENSTILTAGKLLCKGSHVLRASTPAMGLPIVNAVYRESAPP